MNKLRLFVSMAAALIVTTASLQAARAQEPFEQILFDGNTDRSYYSFRIPALISFRSRKDGADVVLAFAEARKRCGRDAGDIDLVQRASRDGGQTWSKRKILAGRRFEGQPDRSTWGNPTAVYDADTHTVWLFMNQNSANRAQFPCRHMCSKKRAKRCKNQRLESKIGIGDRRVYVTHSTNEGRSWATPQDITRDVQYAGTTWDAVGPGNGIQLSRRCGRGALMVPAIGRNIYSTDHGKTWQASRKLPPGTSESTLVELSDGSLMRNDRPASRELNQTQRRPVTVSRDCGASWDSWQPQAELATTRVHGSLIRLNSSWGDALVFANPSSTESRRNMTLRLSENGGQSWSTERVVHAGVAGYSSLSELSDGTLGLLYEKGRNGAKSHGAIAFFKAPLRWLASGERTTTEFATGLDRARGDTNAPRSSQDLGTDDNNSSWSNPDQPARQSGSTWSNPDSSSNGNVPYNRDDIRDLPWLKTR